MDRILTERRGHILVVTINRPEAKNAFDSLSAKAMHAAMDLLDAEDALADAASAAMVAVDPGRLAGARTAIDGISVQNSVVLDRGSLILGFGGL